MASLPTNGGCGSSYTRRHVDRLSERRGQVVRFGHGVGNSAVAAVVVCGRGGSGGGERASQHRKNLSQLIGKLDGEETTMTMSTTIRDLPSYRVTAADADNTT